MYTWLCNVLCAYILPYVLLVRLIYIELLCTFYIIILCTVSQRPSLILYYTKYLPCLCVHRVPGGASRRVGWGAVASLRSPPPREETRPSMAECSRGSYLLLTGCKPHRHHRQLARLSNGNEWQCTNWYVCVPDIIIISVWLSVYTVPKCIGSK